MVDRILSLASDYGRYGYRRITALLRNEGWLINHKRVERIWRKEGLRVPSKQPKRRRLWLNDGSCIRLRPERKDHVWSYDFITIWLSNGKRYRALVILDEFTRECSGLYAAKHITSQCVMNRLYNLFISRNIPEHIRSDNVLNLESSFFFGYTDPCYIDSLNQTKAQVASTVLGRLFLP